MQTQRGFVGLAVLIAIVAGLIVVGSGAYFIIHENAAQQTPTQDTILQTQSDIANTPSATPPTQNQEQTTNTPVVQASNTTQANCPNTYPPSYVVSTAVTIESNPTGEVTIAQGERTPAAGLAAFQEMLTLIADKQGESKEATDDSIIVSLQALNACRVQLLVNAVVAGGDSVWAGSLLSIPSGAISLTSSEKTSLIHVVEHSNDSLDAQAVLYKYSATLSAADKQALQAVITNYGSPAHTATQSSALSTYTNAQYGFSVQYPADLTIYTDASQSYSRLYPAFNTPNTPSTSLFVATDKTTGALFVVGISTDSTQVADCLVAPQSDPAGGAQISNVGNVVLNGTTFLDYQSEVEALGFIINEHDYLVLRGYTCLAIREVPPTDQSLLISTLQSQSQLSSAQQTMLQQAQQAQVAAPHVSAELNAMVQSFRF
jgi:hypothetical protein